MLVSIYGLAFDPATVGPQLQVLRDLLPESAFHLIADRVNLLVSKPAGTLTFSLLVSIMIALWSASTGTKSILGALTWPMRSASSAASCASSSPPWA